MKLIFIHGAGGIKETWHYQVEHFTGAEALDLPGHPEGAPCPTLGEYTDWVHRYILEKEYKDVILVGHSMGGGIVLDFALRYPGDLMAIILLASGARLRVAPAFIEETRQAMSDREILARRLKDHYQNVAPELRDSLIRRQVWEVGPGPLLNDWLACDKFDVMGQVEKIRLPALLIVGSQDIMTPLKYSQFIAGRVPGARVEVVKGGGHFVHLEKPQAVNRAIEEFLGQLKGV